MTIFSHFLQFSGPWNCLGNKEQLSNFHQHYSMCTFYKGKFHEIMFFFIPKKLIENVKNSKMKILVIFCYFQDLGPCLDSKEETSSFNKMFYSVYNFHWEKFEGVISLQKKRKSSPFPVIFGHFRVPQTSLGSMEKLLNFQEMLCFMCSFCKE